MNEVEAGTRNVAQFLSDLSLKEDDEKQQFTLRYINNFNKGDCFSPMIKIHLSSSSKKNKGDEPMIMEFKIGNFGEIKYFLAPKILN